MQKMSASLLVMALLAPAVSAAPAPDRAKEKLEALKKKLPTLVPYELRRKEVGTAISADKPAPPEVQVARQISPTKAKITVLIPAFQKGERSPINDELLTLYLDYYDGTWTTTRYEITWNKEDYMKKYVLFLMLDIDKLGEK